MHVDAAVLAKTPLCIRNIEKQLGRDSNLSNETVEMQKLMTEV